MTAALRRLLLSRRLAWGGFTLAAAVLALLSLHPHPEELIPITMWDKLEHFLAYATLAIVLGHAVFLTLGARRALAAALTVLGASAYGVLMEILQHWFPPRTPDVWDAVANAIGACIGIALFLAGRAALRPIAVRAGVLAALLLAAIPGCGDAPLREPPLAPGQPIERFIREQAALLGAHPVEDVRRFYATIEARSRADDRRTYRYLVARLEPERQARRGALEVLLAEKPPFLEAALALGDLAYEDGDGRTALAFWDRGDPESARIMARRALALDDHALAQRALAAYDAAPWKVPDGFFAAAALACGERDRGVRLLDEARALGLEDATGALVRGLARLAADDAEGASRAFERAIALGTKAIVPRAAYARATLGRLGAWLRGPLRPEEEADAEELALLAAERFPDVTAFHRAAALAALRRGDDAAALERVRRALALDPGDGPSARLARLLLVRAGRPEEAFDVWLRTLPAPRVFASENELLARFEALRDAAHNPRARAALSRALAACGLVDEADAVGAGDPETLARVDLGRAVRAALAALPRDATVADALAAARQAASRAGLAPEACAIEARDGEAGTLATPDAPLVRALLDAGLALDVRPGAARVVVALASRRRSLASGLVARELLVEGADAGLAPPAGLLGRATPLGTGFFLELDAIRPSAAEVSELARALGSPERTPQPTPPAGSEDALATSAELRAELVRRAAPLLANAGDPPPQLFAALLEARLRYVGEHESGHVVDLARLVPVAAHPLNNIARVIDGGLAPADVAGRYEEIAELFALAQDPAPYVALLSMQRALPDLEGGLDLASAGAPAAARAASEAVFRALRDGARAMLEEPHAPLARALAVLDPAMIRRIARRRLGEEGIAVGGPP
jgi:VanZ family protein